MFKELLADVFPVIEKAAPILATTLSGSYVGIASIVLGLITKAFGVEKHDIQGLIRNILEDPEAPNKLMQVQSDIPAYMMFLKDVIKLPQEVQVNVKLVWGS